MLLFTQEQGKEVSMKKSLLLTVLVLGITACQSDKAEQVQPMQYDNQASYMAQNPYATADAGYDNGANGAVGQTGYNAPQGSPYEAVPVTQVNVYGGVATGAAQDAYATGAQAQAEPQCPSCNPPSRQYEVVTECSDYQDRDLGNGRYSQCRICTNKVYSNGQDVTASFKGAVTNGVAVANDADVGVAVATAAGRKLNKVQRAQARAMRAASARYQKQAPQFVEPHPCNQQ